IRPHDVARAGGDEVALTLGVDVIEAMGFEAYAHGTVGKTTFVARLESDARSLPREGEQLALRVDASTVHLFDPESGRALATGGDAG
ncbi:MAG: TOBE domain-containing protein, partial [Deltaproteobacteria bacterium]